MLCPLHFQHVHLCRRFVTAERENNLVIGLTNTAPNVTPPTVSSVTICGRGPAVATAGQLIAVSCAAGLAPARYVVVLSPQEYLTICELEVYGTGKVVSI